MNKFAVIAALATGGLVTLAFAASNKETRATGMGLHTAAIASKLKAGTKKCTFLPGGGTLESKPQSPEYRGGCLEYLPHIELEDTRGLPLPLFTGATNDGSRAQARSAHGHHGNAQVGLKLQPVIVEGHPFGSVQFYEVRSELGEDLCQEETYDVLEASEKSSGSWLSKLKGKAIAIPGYWEEQAWHHSPIDAPGASAFTLSCVSGAMAKCALWGYAPWAQHAGMGLEAFHVACVQAVRARYLKHHDTAYTCRGTVIDIYDRLGILKKDDASLRFESRWGEKGLDCLAESRFPVCKDELGKAGLQADKRGCVDPADSSWPDGVLIAIGSSGANTVASPDNLRGGPVCPSQIEQGCTQR
jgi:hypothetical protein